MKINIRKMVITAMLSAVAALLMYVEFPIAIFPGFLKIDFSDVPALIAVFLINPLAGVAVELIKNLVHLPSTQSGGIGELANFIVGVSFVLPAGLLYRYIKIRGKLVISLIVGTVCMSIAAAFANYYILLPFYSHIMPIDVIIKMCSDIIPAIDSLEKVVLFSIVPFNLFKGAIITIVTLLIFNKRLIKGLKTIMKI